MTFTPRSPAVRNCSASRSVKTLSWPTTRMTSSVASSMRFPVRVVMPSLPESDHTSWVDSPSSSSGDSSPPSALRSDRVRLMYSDWSVFTASSTETARNTCGFECCVSTSPFDSSARTASYTRVRGTSEPSLTSFAVPRCRRDSATNDFASYSFSPSCWSSSIDFCSSVISSMGSQPHSLSVYWVPGDLLRRIGSHCCHPVRYIELLLSGFSGRDWRGIVQLFTQLITPRICTRGSDTDVVRDCCVGPNPSSRTDPP
jgi:hypothetical protein